MFKFKMGQKVRDTATGFEGTVVGAALWFSGARGALLAYPSGKDGGVDTVWIDEARLEMVAPQAAPGEPS